MARAEEKADVWMPLYIGDYLADTARLTTEQHGAYLLLMMDYWRNGAPPDEKIVLQNVTRLTDFLWKKHWPVLQKFFVLIEGHWHHKRLDEEIAKATAGKAEASEKARRAAEARWGKSDAPSNAQAHAPSMLEECPSPSPSPLPTVNTSHTDTDGGTSYARDEHASQPAAVEISKSLREWERARGKFPRNITPSQEQVIELAAMAPTAEELRKAYELAVEARENDSDPAPINAGFVRTKLDQLRRPPPPKREPQVSPRSMNDVQLNALGRELGIGEARVGESRDAFIARIQQKQAETRGRAA
ncbi:DUF1376 domain-containing protein [Burkholderia sp. Bp8995]|uniref:YdaU family protein n=1 Tax=Burkholderia sp. Bp8995 TaxID=2184556 RepID=UPI00162A4516|nr:DUF1376 domain-containing protein [Burkholderia sp. Bp8995]